MSTTSTVTASPTTPTQDTSVDQGRARAYCGPAHGHCWVLDPVAVPPSSVELGVGSDLTCYRLVHHPRTRRPARDYWGNYLYMPLSFESDA